MTGSMGSECDDAAMTALGESMAHQFMAGLIDWTHTTTPDRDRPRTCPCGHITGMSPCNDH